MSVAESPYGRYTPAEEAAWYARLPTMFGAAAALFTGTAGRVLLVKPNYRDHWPWRAWRLDALAGAGR